MTTTKTKPEETAKKPAKKPGLLTNVKKMADGLKITLEWFFTKPATFHYPDEKRMLPADSRQILYLDYDDCGGCNQCERACPVNCITVKTVKTLPDEDLGVDSKGQQKRLHVAYYAIDMAKCCYCNLCTMVCPTECLHMLPDYERSEYERRDLIYRFSPRTREEAERFIAEQQAKLDEIKKQKAAEKEKAAAAKKAAPKADKKPAASEE
jgi:NADH-quinone oxidoreductase subunit I